VLWERGVFYSILPLSKEIQGHKQYDERCGCDREPKMGRNLLVEMFHRSGTENDEEADPERGSLEGNCLIGLFITFFCLI